MEAAARVAVPEESPMRLGLIILVALLSSCATPRSIYGTVDREATLMNAYQQRLASWPLPYERRWVPTSYGLVHVIASGPTDAPPVLMLHAMGVSATMWRHNVAALARDHRVVCVDFIGDLGPSRLWVPTEHPRDGGDVAALLVEVLDELALGRVDVVGASYGGWAALNLAARAPSRVRRVALLGPMGVAPATADTIERVASLVLLPTEDKKRDMVNWTLGPSPAVRADLEDYMMEAMECRGALAPPTTIPDSWLSRIEAPVLLLLGDRDGPVGPAEPARQRMIHQVPTAEVVVLPDTGHMMSIERPDVVGSRLVAFLGS